MNGNYKKMIADQEMTIGKNTLTFKVTDLIAENTGLGGNGAWKTPRLRPVHLPGSRGSFCKVFRLA